MKESKDFVLGHLGMQCEKYVFFKIKDNAI
jgi:hypothetical protein